MEKKSNAKSVSPSKTSGKSSGSIDLGSLSKLMQLMTENAITEVEYDDGNLALRLSKTAGTVSAPVVAAPAAAPVVAATAAAASPAAASEDNLLKIPSPMVGTFYASPSPDAGVYVSVGSEVSDDTVVCLIEAMKVFNEIKAGVSGRIVKVLVKSEDPVEFGQPMFLVEPV